MEDSAHFEDMLHERQIAREWANRAIREPDQTEDRTRHFIKQIPEFGNRWLRVIVNTNSVPAYRVTAFFDRRLSRPS